MRIDVGIDGCRAGWVLVSRRRPRDAPAVRVVARLDDALREIPIRGTIAMIDIPLGLLDARMGSGDRACDKLARRALGRPRSASVFPPPRRDQLALAGAPWRPGLGLNRQTHAILPRIAEADAHRARLREAHPEIAFERAGVDVALPKRSPAGAAARERALIARGLGGLPVPRGARPDDVRDAAILCWLAGEARARRVGAYGRGEMRIWGAPRG